MKFLINFFVGMFRGWYSERSRDKAHEDLGATNANLKNQQETNKKIQAANNAEPDLSPDGLQHDTNATKYD